MCLFHGVPPSLVRYPHPKHGKPAHTPHFSIILTQYHSYRNITKYMNKALFSTQQDKNSPGFRAKGGRGGLAPPLARAVLPNCLRETAAVVRRHRTVRAVLALALADIVKYEKSTKIKKKIRSN